MGKCTHGGCPPKAGFEILKNGIGKVYALKDDTDWYDNYNVYKRKGGYIFYVDGVEVHRVGLEEMDTPFALGSGSNFENLNFIQDGASDIKEYLESLGFSVTENVGIARWSKNGNCKEAVSPILMFEIDNECENSYLTHTGDCYLTHAGNSYQLK